MCYMWIIFFCFYNYMIYTNILCYKKNFFERIAPLFGMWHSIVYTALRKAIVVFLRHKKAPFIGKVWRPDDERGAL